MDRKQRIVLIVAILASFVAFLDGSVVNVALPAIMRDFGGGLVLQQWVVDAYLITLGAFMLLAGSLSDLYGRRRILAIGLAVFGLSSILCAGALNGPMLISMRALQGIGGALLVPSSLAIIVATFTREAQGKAIGSWTAWTGMAFLFGPLLGGFFVDTVSWRLIFAINIVPITVTLWLLQKLDMPIGRRDKSVKLDTVGALMGVVSLSGLVYGLIEQAHYGWSSGIVASSLLLGLVALGVFIWQERRTRNPMLPLSLFTLRNFAIGNVATLGIYAGLSVVTFLLAVFVQQVGGYSAFQAGLALLPVTIIMFVLSPRFGALAGRFGPRLFMAIGPLVAAIGFLLMLMVDKRVVYASQLLPGILLFGLGLSVTVAPLTAAVLGSITSRHAGIASAVNNMIARVAGLLGIAALGMVTGRQLDVDGFHAAITATAVLLATGGLVSAVGILNEPNKQTIKTTEV